jgi:hypothetical protein
MDLDSATGSTKKDERFIDSVQGTEDDAYRAAFKYADILRKKFGIPTLSVKVEEAGWGWYYLYVVPA